MKSKQMANLFWQQPWKTATPFTLWLQIKYCASGDPAGKPTVNGSVEPLTGPSNDHSIEGHLNLTKDKLQDR
jgi:hypothetical protein